MEQINKGGGKVIGVDLYLAEPDATQPENDAFLAGRSVTASRRHRFTESTKTDGQGFASESISQPMDTYKDTFESIGITELET